MRSILMSVLLIVVVIVLYTSFTGGDEGLHEQLSRSGNRMSETIARQSP